MCFENKYTKSFAHFLILPHSGYATSEPSSQSGTTVRAPVLSSLSLNYIYSFQISLQQFLGSIVFATELANLICTSCLPNNRQNLELVYASKFSFFSEMSVPDSYSQGVREVEAEVLSLSKEGDV